MKITQQLTKAGKWGVFLFFAGPALTLLTRYFLLRYLHSLIGTGITQMPDLTIYYLLEGLGLLMFAPSIPMIILGREFNGREIVHQKDEVMWQ